MNIRNKVSTQYSNQAYKSLRSETSVATEEAPAKGNPGLNQNAEKLAWNQFEKARVRRAASQVQAGPEAAAAEKAQKSFQDQFGQVAGDKEKFHSLMKEVYGKGYDAAAAENFRQRALRNDYSWLPRIEFKPEALLGGGNGAFDGSRNVVYINDKYMDDPTRAAKVYSEEVGHFFDTQLKKSDTIGDEGEMFRKLLAGDKLSAADKAAIRADNDHGVINVNGKATKVEFSIFDDIGKAVSGAAKAVGGAVSGAAKAVGGAVSSAAKAVGGAVSSAAKAVGSAVSSAAKAVGSAAKTVGSAIWGGIKKVGNGIADAAKWVAPRLWDGIRGLGTGIMDSVTSAFRNIGEGLGTFAGGVGKLFKGDFSGGFKDMGMGLLKTFVQTPVDALLLTGGRAISAIQTLVGLEPVGRKLTDDEIETLKKVYGNSIDYSKVRIKEGDAGLMGAGGTAFTHGNTIYIPKDSLPLKEDLLVHEMGHVWQHQNGGSDYMSEALWAQKVGDGYDWQKGVAEGKSWSELNPEQQAELLQDAQLNGFFANENGKFEKDGVDYTQYLKDALKQVRAGQGAT
jgi:hypothetical protein